MNDDDTTIGPRILNDQGVWVLAQGIDDIVWALRKQGDHKDADMLLLAASGVDFYEEVKP